MEGSAGGGSAGGGGSSGRSCADIENDYLMAATGGSALTCSVSSDCAVHFGLCTGSGGLVRGNAKGTYNKTTVDQLKSLDAEWKTKACGGSACQGSAGGTLGCTSNRCTAS